ncbi:hypothetical protein LCGC14_0498670 [marine sediment metagenome]|uniref:HNH nuclease domain-containing protein n=1 Tax=marine sediment metagenome TaxID=412755 RepID=A0A0F9VDB4_9ZZZZ
MITAFERFLAKIDIVDDCWVWTGSKRGRGYGGFWFNRHQVYVHRFAYQVYIGPIPEGLQIDHLCRNLVCINPQHLEVVTQKENIFRGENFTAINAAKTHCPQGHPYDLFNTYFSLEGERKCRICRRDFERLRYHRV